MSMSIWHTPAWVRGGCGIKILSISVLHFVHSQLIYCVSIVLLFSGAESNKKLPVNLILSIIAGARPM